MTARPSLPIISLAPFLHPPSHPDATRESKLRAATLLHKACSTHGFFYLSHHGIPSSLCNLVLDHARRFFLSTSPASKSAIARRDPEAGGDGARGYQKLGENLTKNSSDYHEAIDFYRLVALEPFSSGGGYKLLRGPNLWPEDADNTGFKQAFEEYWSRMLELGDKVMIAMAWALGYEDDEEVILRHTKEAFWVARVIGYPPLPKGAEGKSCGEHTDYGCTTFLLADQTKGALQVQAPDGGWLDADPVDGAMVVNIGDMMQVWTNGLWKSTVHRVVHKGDNYRVSVPFFYEPDWEARVKPLERCIKASGGHRKFEETIYKEHIMGKVAGNFYSGGNDAGTAGN
ncbi:hypothetical protein BZA77DRAFT_25956 [Pyronema omphalodes]|nr:hypothetical protein BZA77DRAFT_25956 [Pyronema omphalodes]